MQNIENQVKKYQTVGDLQQANILGDMKRVSSAKVISRNAKKSKNAPTLMQVDFIKPINKKIKLVQRKQDKARQDPIQGQELSGKQKIIQNDVQLKSNRYLGRLQEKYLKSMKSNTVLQPPASNTTES